MNWGIKGLRLDTPDASSAFYYWQYGYWVEVGWWDYEGVEDNRMVWFSTA